MTITMTLTITITSCYEGEDSSCLVGGGGGARIPCPTPSAHRLYRPLCPSPCGAVPPALRHIPRSGWLCEYSEQEETKSTLTVFFIGIYSELILIPKNPFRFRWLFFSADVRQMLYRKDPSIWNLFSICGFLTKKPMFTVMLFIEHALGTLFMAGWL